MAKKPGVLSPELAQTFNELEDNEGLPNGILSRIAKTESNFRPNAIGRPTKYGTAKGMFQFIDSTAQQYGVNQFDPVSSAQGAAKYLGDLYRRYNGNLDKAVAAYNWGPGNVDKHGIDSDKLPEETRKYIAQTSKKINGGIQYDSQMSKPNSTITAGSAMSSNNQFPSPDDILSQVGYTEPNKSEDNNQQSQNMNQQHSNIPSADDILSQVGYTQEDPTVNQNTAQAPAGNPQQIPDLNAQPNYNVNQQILQQDNKDKSLYDSFAQLNPDQQVALYQNYKQQDPRKAQVILDSLQRYVGDNPNVQHSSGITNFLTGFGKAGNDIFNRIGQGVGYAKAQLTGDQSTYNKYNQAIDRSVATDELNDAANPSVSRSAGEIAGQTAPFLVGAPEIIAARTLAGRTGALAADGAVQSVLSTNQAQDINDYAKNTGTTAGIGAVAAPVVSKVASTIINPVAKVIAGRLPSEAAEAQRLAQQQGIDLLGGDLPGASNSAQKAAQDLTMDSPRVQQQVENNINAAKTSIDNLKNKYNTFDSADYLSRRADLVAASQDNGPYSQQAKNAIQKINAAKNPEDVLKATAEAQHVNNRIQSNNLYDKASLMAPTSYTIDANNFARSLESVRADLNSARLPSTQGSNNKLLDDVEYLRNNINAQSIDLSDANNLVKDLGNASRNARQSGDFNLERQYKNIRQSLMSDIDNTVDNINDPALTDFARAYKEAKSFNAKNIQSVNNDNDLSKIFNSVDNRNNPISADGAINKFVQAGKPDQVNKLWNLIDEDGKQAVRAAVYNNLIDKATTPNGNFDPRSVTKAYNSTFKNDKSPLSTIFDNDRDFQNQLKVFDKIKTAGYVKFNPQNGRKWDQTVQKYLPILAGGSAIGAYSSDDYAKEGVSGAAGSIALLAALKGRTALLSRQMTDPAFKKLSFELSQTNPNSANFLNRLERYLGYLSADSIAQPQADYQQQYSSNEEQLRKQNDANYKRIYGE